MRLAMMMTIGVLVSSAHAQPGLVLAHQKITDAAPACPPFGPRMAFGQFLDLRVDGDNGSPTGDGSDWGVDAYKYLQDALADAADPPPGTTVRLWVAATDPSSSYVPDRDAANPDGTGDRESTFLLDFDNVQLLGGFPPGGGDLEDRDPALYETVLSGVLTPHCGAPTAGNCFQPNGTPRCNDAECCEAVCTVDPDCCEVAWDQACADLAFTVCGSCGDQGSGDCFVANGTPGCDDAACCSMVCVIDPSCCLTAWDQECADLATQICGLCGEPGSGDCFEANGTPGCEDAACCEIVCAADPDCCTDQWDQLCAAFANLVCGVCGEPDSGSCFEDNDTPGCEEGNCCALVCEQEIFCCIVEWDQPCADIALQLCDQLMEEEDPPPRAYHVVTASFVDDSVRIDGVTITFGLADEDFNNGLGGGMLILSASPAVIRVTFTENSAPAHGGGAMHVGGASDPIVVNTSFIQNTGNEAGALHIENDENGNPGGTFVNCLFSGNASLNEGGAINPGGATTLTLINCTLVDNTVDNAQGGGAIFVEGQPAGVNLTNCILWGNLAGGNPNQIDGNLRVVTVKYSDVEGGWGVPMDMNINDDPLFVDPTNGDYRLSSGSPCIDAGNNWDVPVDELDYDGDGVLCELFPVDLDGNPRFNADEVDFDPGCGVPVVVDMGAYEYQFDPVDQVTFADLNGDNTVGAADLLGLLVGWGPCAKGCCLADLDLDANVGASDLLALLVNWGPCP
ncbi:MAG: right-handed parallel beta-helix repeat-containing protein [Phycisphaerales bacterium]